MPKTVSITITIPDDVDEQEISDWIEAIGDELKDSTDAGSRWIITGNYTAPATKGEITIFNKNQKDDDGD